MKNWQIRGFIAILILGFILVSGCAGTEKSPATVTITQTPAVTQVSARTFTSTPTPSPTLTPSPQPVVKTVLFSDDLSHWRSEWDEEYDYSDGKIFYSENALHIRATDPKGTLYHSLHRNFNNFILDIDARTVGGSLNNWEGVNIRVNNDNNDYYGLSISADGYYAIVKFENNIRQALAGPTLSGYINTGIGATNHIHVEADKNSLSLSVNGHPLRTVTDNSYTEGIIDLKANCITPGTFTEVAYTNLVITTI